MNPQIVPPSPPVLDQHSSEPFYCRTRFWSLCVAITIFPLIWAGGLVTTNDAGMAVPDWPGTFGYNLFLYPISTWISGPYDLFVEHGHRLLGAFVGLLAIALVAVAFAKQTSKKLRLWSLALLIAIICQGLLGGVRVLAVQQRIALIHGCTGPLVFLLASYVVVLSGRSRSVAIGDHLSSQAILDAETAINPIDASRLKEGFMTRGFHWWTTILALSTIFQLIIGASLRHAEPTLKPVGFMAITHLHLTFATIIFVLTVVTFLRSWTKKASYWNEAKRYSGLLFLLICVQVGLGIATWFVNYAWPWSGLTADLATHVNELKGFWETMIVTGHQAVGSLILVTSFLLSLAAWRLSQFGAKNHFIKQVRT